MTTPRAAGFSPRGHDDSEAELPAILERSRTRVVFGPGTISRLGACAKQEGATRVLVVTDPGIVAAGTFPLVGNKTVAFDLGAKLQIK